MSIHELEAFPDDFQAYIWESQEDLAILQRVQGASLLADWTSPTVIPARSGTRKSVPLGDIASLMLGSGILCFSESATETLAPLLDEFGEWLPVRCRQRPLFVYNCTHIVDALDTEKSEALWGDDGEILTIMDYSWKSASRPKSAFRIPQMIYSPTFVGEDVVAKVSSAGLRGFRLSPRG